MKGVTHRYLPLTAFINCLMGKSAREIKLNTRQLRFLNTVPFSRATDGYETFRLKDKLVT